jgi:UDPglucose 6-dehydrogenase
LANPESTGSNPGQICVIGGAGYVGLTTAVGFAESGRSVVSVDLDSDRIQNLARGESPIYEEGIEDLLKTHTRSGRLTFTTDAAVAIANSDTIFIAVGTPASSDGRTDLSQVIGVAEDVARHLSGYTVIVIRSTVPVGTADTVRDILSQSHEEGRDYDLVANPEFLREGKALEDFFYPERIVIGTDSDSARERMREIYAPITSGDETWGHWGRDRSSSPVPLVETNLPDAELIKHAANAFLATRISFINEIAALCERVGADIDQVKSGLGLDPRIGTGYLDPGLGFGGPCLEKDLTALVTIAEDVGFEPVVLRAVYDRNERQVASIISKVKGHIGPSLYGRPLAVLGVAFKANTGDVRNSLALRVAKSLEGDGADVRIYDPMAMPEAKQEMRRAVFCADAYEAADGAEALLVLTEWAEFAELDFERIKGALAIPTIIDGRNLLDPEALRAIGFEYQGVGRR